MELIGREEYLQEFTNYLEKIKTNERIVFNIYGLRGIGKSVLLQAFKKKSKAIEIDVIELDFKLIKVIGDFYAQLDIELAAKEIETRYFDLAYLIYFQKKNPKITIQGRLPSWVEDFGDISELIGLGGAVIGPAKSIFKGFNKLKNKFELDEEILKNIKKLYEKDIVEIENELIQFLSYDIEFLSERENYNGINFLMDSYENIDSLLDEELYSFIEKLDKTKSFFVIASKNHLGWENNFIHSKKVIPLSDSESKKILMGTEFNESELVSKVVMICEGIGSYLALAIKIFNKRNKESNEEILLKINNELLKNKKNINSKILNSSIYTNRPSYINKQYNNDIFRERTYTDLHLVLKNKKEPNSLCMVYGSPGIGKSSFMATSFSRLVNEEFNKVIYFLEDGNDDLKEIDSLYKLIENNILVKFQEQNINFDNSIIYGDSDILDKLEYLLDTYSQKIYLAYDKPFIVMIDGLDTLVEHEKFVSKLVKNHKGIHFVFSTRKKFHNDFYTLLKNKNKDLYIYNNRNGISLENLDKDSTYLYFDKTQELDSFLDEKEITSIKESIYLASKGLPKYFELLIKKLNKLIFNDRDDSYEKVEEYIQKLPEELEDFYIEEFNNIKKSSNLSLEILIVFYWYSRTIEKSTLKYFIAEENIEIIDSALNEISHFLNMSENKYQINHLSIKEALFVYFQKDEFEKLTAIKLEESFIKKTFQNETPILKYLADNDSIIYELFSSIYYMKNSNILFKGLKSIVETSLQNKFLQKKQDILPLYFNFIRILFAQDMISSEILSNDNFKVTELFKNDKISENTKKFSLNILALHSNSYKTNIYDLRLLLSLAILGQNNYFISKFLEKYKKIKHYENYNDIFADEVLNKDKYNNLNSISSKTYVSMYSKLTNKELDSTLSLYEDGGLILLYDNTWSNNINKNIMSILIQIQTQQGKKQRNFHEKQIRIYQTLKHSVNIKLKKYFYNTMDDYVEKSDLSSNKMKIFMNQVLYDILLQDIENLSFSNKMYKYLHKDEKVKIDIIYQFYISYKEHSLGALLKDENLDFFPEISYFVKTEDIIEFMTFYIKHSDKKTFLLIDIFIRKENTSNILIFCKDYLIKKTFVSLTLSIIYYKLGEIKKLEKTIFKIESEREERRLLNGVLNSIEKELLDIYPLLSKTEYTGHQFLTKYLQRSTFSQKELDFFGKIISQKDFEIFSKHLAEMSFILEDSNKIKEIRDKDFLKNEDMKIISLNIMRLDNFDKFVEQFYDLDNDFKIVFLDKVLTYYLKVKKNVSSELLYLVFNTILNNKYNKNMYKILTKIYKRQNYIDFCIENHELIEKVYLSIDKSLSEDALKTKALLYKLSINYRQEDEYFELLEKEWIPNDTKSRIAMVFIVKMKNKEAMENLSIYCQSLDKAKVLIHMGTMFDDMKKLKEGIVLLYKFKNEKNKNIKYFENYLEFTLIHNKSINKESSNFIKSIFIPKYKNKTLLSTFLNIEKFINTNEFLEDYIQFPKEFLVNYLSYVEFENKINDSHFNDIDKITLENLVILYVQYKEAEEQEDEENYHKFENIFSLLKIEYADTLTGYFNEVETLSLDNMFSRVNYKNTNLKELINTEYLEFYKQIQNLYNDSIGKDREKADIAQNEFEQLKESIKDSDEYMKLLKEKSWIKSNLSLKLGNVELFRPK